MNNSILYVLKIWILSVLTGSFLFTVIYAGLGIYMFNILLISISHSALYSLPALIILIINLEIFNRRYKLFLTRINICALCYFLCFITLYCYSLKNKSFF